MSDTFLENSTFINRLTEFARDNDPIDPALYQKYDVKRGLRYADGRGVLVGLTSIGDVVNRLMSSASLFNEKNRMVLRRFIAPAQEVEFDKNGRLSIPQSLREYAGLSKDCTVLGVDKYIEIWDAVSYKEYLSASEESFRDAAEGLSGINF